MRKLFTLLCAIILASVSIFAAKDVAPKAADLANYYDEGQLCVAVYFEGEICNDIVFIGTYNGWNDQDVTTMVKFEPVEGFEGWWVVAVTDDSEDIQGKPVQLKSDGTVAWEFQTGDKWQIISGTVTIEPGYAGEANLKGYDNTTPVVLVSEGWKDDNTPCGDFAIDGVIYSIISNTLYCVEVCDVTSSIAPNVVIPSSVNIKGIEYAVTGIGNEAFEGCTGLTSITIPEGVTSIGYYAFFNCTGLTSITIPEGVTSIGNYAFDGCKGLTSIEVAGNNPNYTTVDGVLFNKDKTTLLCHPAGKQGAYTIPESITSIDDGAFSGCTGLTTITIPEGVTSIGNYAFDGCKGLTSITIPENVTSIGDGAFSGCKGLTTITIPESVTSIGDWAFYDCIGLTSIAIPKGVTSIDDGAFYDCTGLTSITIPEGVTSIDYFAFEGCYNLISVTCLAEEVPITGEGVFANYDATLYVPCESVEAYQQDAVFGLFAHIEGINCETTSVENTTVDGLQVVGDRIVCNEAFRIYTITGIDYTAQNGNLPAGVYIVRTATTAQQVLLP